MYTLWQEYIIEFCWLTLLHALVHANTLMRKRLMSPSMRSHSWENFAWENVGWPFNYIAKQINTILDEGSTNPLQLFYFMKIIWFRKWHMTLPIVHLHENTMIKEMKKNLHHYPPPWEYYSIGSDSQPFTRIMIMCKICLRNFHTTIHYDASLLEYYVGWSMGCQILEDPSYDKT